MARRKTPEEMALWARTKMLRAVVRAKYSSLADYELNDLLAKVEDDHNLELAQGGVKQIGPGAVDKVIEEIADLDERVPK